jgi:hypothetical protein
MTNKLIKMFLILPLIFVASGCGKNKNAISRSEVAKLLWEYKNQTFTEHDEYTVYAFQYDVTKDSRVAKENTNVIYSKAKSYFYLEDSGNVQILYKDKDNRTLKYFSNNSFISTTVVTPFKEKKDWISEEDWSNKETQFSAYLFSEFYGNDKYSKNIVEESYTYAKGVLTIHTKTPTDDKDGYLEYNLVFKDGMLSSAYNLAYDKVYLDEKITLTADEFIYPE